MSFKKKYPDIQLNADFEDRLIDLEIDNYDFAIRITPEVPEGVITRRLGVVRDRLCASQLYIKKWTSRKLKAIKVT